MMFYKSPFILYCNFLYTAHSIHLSAKTRPTGAWAVGDDERQRRGDGFDLPKKGPRTLKKMQKKLQ